MIPIFLIKKTYHFLITALHQTIDLINMTDQSVGCCINSES